MTTVPGGRGPANMNARYRGRVASACSFASSTERGVRNKPVIEGQY